MAPGRPNQRLPRTIEALPRFGPGSTWQRPMVSVKSACVSQRRSSTIARYAHGNTPPNERAPIERKPRNSSLRSRGGVTFIFNFGQRLYCFAVSIAKAFPKRTNVTRCCALRIATVLELYGTNHDLRALVGR